MNNYKIVKKVVVGIVPMRKKRSDDSNEPPTFSEAIKKG
jgi:hypothetical protein